MRVVIVGAGFAGLAAVRALAHRQVAVTLIERHNYHLFQPLLYQVATAALNPTDIAWPVRSLIRRQSNAVVLMTSMTGVDRGRASSIPTRASIAPSTTWCSPPARATPISGMTNGRPMLPD